VEAFNFAGNTVCVCDKAQRLLSPDCVSESGENSRHANTENLDGKRIAAFGIYEPINLDWGECTQILTKLHGREFAVLNFANAFVPGGGYVEGCSAQKENIFRRTDLHFHGHRQIHHILSIIIFATDVYVDQC